MTQLLQKAISQVSTLNEAEQDRVASWLLEELASEARWDTAFAKSHDLLAAMAAEALAEHEAGLTEPLDPDTL